MTTLLVDADIIPYEIGFVMEKDEVRDWAAVKAAVDNRIDQIREGVAKVYTVNSVELWLSDPDGVFRTEYATILPYKGTRKRAKPFHWDGIRAYLRDLGAQSMKRLEGDDAICIRRKSIESDTIIASRDKDFDQSPGLRYIWAYGDNTEQWRDLSDAQSKVAFWTQMLVGDKQVDNILGLFGVGHQSTMVKRLRTFDTHLSMGQSVGAEYKKRFGAYWSEFFFETMLLLKLVEDTSCPPEEFSTRWFRSFFDNDTEAGKFLDGEFSVPEEE